VEHFPKPYFLHSSILDGAGSKSHAAQIPKLL